MGEVNILGTYGDKLGKRAQDESGRDCTCIQQSVLKLAGRGKLNNFLDLVKEMVPLLIVELKLVNMSELKKNKEHNNESLLLYTIRNIL